MLLRSHIDKTESELSTLDLVNPPPLMFQSAEIRFDTTQHISQSYWDNLLRDNFTESRLHIFQQHEQPKSQTALKIAAQLAVAKLLSCPKIDQIQDPIGLSEYLKNFIDCDWNHDTDDQMELFYATLTRYICCPAESNLTNSQYQNWEGIFDIAVAAQIQFSSICHAVALLLTTKMLQPNTNQMQLIENHIQIIKHPLLKELLICSKDIDIWQIYIFLLAATKILFPEDYAKEYSPDIETWEKLLEYFNQSSPDEIDHYLLPIYLKIIASEKTEITPHGLKITEKSSLKTSPNDQIAKLPAIFHHRIQQI